MSNIFVDRDDPTKITSIIDWQSASIEPVFKCWFPVLDFAHPPGYLAYIAEKEKHREMTTTQAWDTALQACLHKAPRLHTLLRSLLCTDIHPFRLFRICHRTWRDGAPLLTSDLIDLAEKWQVSGLPGSCRYAPPTGDELDAHKTRWEWFENFQEIREMIGEKLQASDDGWIPAENWDAVQESHRECFDMVMRLSKEPVTDTTEDDWRAIWPYDTPY
jgi:hypothetical protein